MERFYKLIPLSIFLTFVFLFSNGRWAYDYLETFMSRNDATLWGNLYTLILLLGMGISILFIFKEDKK